MSALMNNGLLVHANDRKFSVLIHQYYSVYPNETQSLPAIPAKVLKLQYGKFSEMVAAELRAMKVSQNRDPGSRYPLVVKELSDVPTRLFKAPASA